MTSNLFGEMFFLIGYTVLLRLCQVMDTSLPTVDLARAMQCKALLVVEDVRKVHCASEPALAFAVAVAGLSICPASAFRENKPVPDHRNGKQFSVRLFLGQ